MFHRELNDSSFQNVTNITFNASGAPENIVRRNVPVKNLRNLHIRELAKIITDYCYLNVSENCATDCTLLLEKYVENIKKNVIQSEQLSLILKILKKNY